jgi:NAD(P)-dependent dehydrogenase (short-subunit alcohol dehydrogenase family)
VTGRLAGKVAVVTGGSRGLGAAIARLYGREGHQSLGFPQIVARTASYQVCESSSTALPRCSR